MENTCRNHLKRLGAILLITLLLPNLGFTERDQGADAFYYENAYELSQAMAVIAASDYPKAVYAGSSLGDEDSFALVAQVAGKAPEAFLVASVEEEKLFRAVRAALAGNTRMGMQNIPAEVETYIIKPRAFSMVISMLNGSAGMAHLVASSILSIGKPIMNPPEGYGPTCALLFYEDSPFAFTLLFAEGEGNLYVSALLMEREAISAFMELVKEESPQNGALSPFLPKGDEELSLFALAFTQQTHYEGEALLALAP